MALGFFIVAVLYTLYRGTVHTVLVGVAFVLMMLGALPRQVALAFLVGASVILLVQTRGSTEGFEDAKAKKDEKAEKAEKAEAEEAETEKGEPDEEKEKEEKGEEKKEKVAAPAKKPAQKESFAGGRNKPMLPDNATRREPLELGKPYKLPSESDDKGYHLDAGTTFLNAYKALKPDQIAAMTRDTQELLATQKSLVSMLDSFGPLMKDMGKITGMLNMN
jgi:hypothetical protein